MEKGQVFGYDVLHLIGNEHLVAIELNLVAVYVKVAFDTREIEYAGKVEGIIHVKVYMEERFVKLRRIEFVVEVLVVVFRQVGGLACPSGCGVVDDVVFVCFHLFAVFPFLFLAEHYLHRQELAVLTEQSLYGGILKILLKLAVDMQYNVCSPVSFDGIFHSVFGIAGARPVNGLGIIFIRQGEDFHLVAHHKR